MPEVPDEVPLSGRPPGVNRWVDQRGSITLGAFAIGWARPSPGGVHQGGRCDRGSSRSSTPESSSPPPPSVAGPTRNQVPTDAWLCDLISLPPTSGMSVTRRVDGGGTVFLRHRPEPAIGSDAAGPISSSTWPSWPSSLQISRHKPSHQNPHAIRHDRSEEHGAFATPEGQTREVAGWPGS